MDSRMYPFMLIVLLLTGLFIFINTQTFQSITGYAPPGGGGGGGGKGAISISASPELSSGVRWDVVVLPASDLSAIGNNGALATLYYVEIQTDKSTKVDLYVRANGDLISGADIIPLANERFNYDKLDTVPSATRYVLTTNFADNKIGLSLRNKDRIYLKFYLDAHGGQNVGTYANQVEFKAVLTGQAP